jgi:hypothetical protein
MNVSLEDVVADRRSFWVLSKQPDEISGFGKNRIPAKFKTVEEAKVFCRAMNLRKGAFHPGYFIEERIGDKPVSVKKTADTDEEG